MLTAAPPWAVYTTRILAGLAGIYLSLYHRWRRQGRENIPRAGPLLIIINHISAMDVLSLGVALVLEGIRPGVDFYTVAKREVFDNPLLARLVPLVGMFPLDRGHIDLHAMRVIFTLFKQGKMLALAPEGTRSPTGQLQLFQPAVAKLAITRRVPILPIGVSGTERAIPLGARIPRPAPISIRFGPVFELSDYYGQELSPEVVERAAWEMRDHVAALLPEWMRELPPHEAHARFGGVRARESAGR